MTTEEEHQATIASIEIVEIAGPLADQILDKILRLRMGLSIPADPILHGSARLTPSSLLATIDCNLDIDAQVLGVYVAQQLRGTFKRLQTWADFRSDIIGSRQLFLARLDTLLVPPGPALRAPDYFPLDEPVHADTPAGALVDPPAVPLPEPYDRILADFESFRGEFRRAFERAAEKPERDPRLDEFERKAALAERLLIALATGMAGSIDRQIVGVSRSPDSIVHEAWLLAHEHLAMFAREKKRLPEDKK